MNENKVLFTKPISKLDRADISCLFKKTRCLCKHCLQNEWTLQTARVLGLMDKCLNMALHGPSWPFMSRTYCVLGVIVDLTLCLLLLSALMVPKVPPHTNLCIPSTPNIDLIHFGCNKILNHGLFLLLLGLKMNSRVN